MTLIYKVQIARSDFSHEETTKYVMIPQSIKHSEEYIGERQKIWDNLKNTWLICFW